MKSHYVLAGIVAFTASGLAVALGGGGNNFDRLSDADRQVLQERFTKEIWPLLERNAKNGCVGCHAASKGGNGMRMTGQPDKDFRFLVKEGFFIPDDAGSVLTRVLSTNKKRMMPPLGKGDRWTKEEIDVLQKFVADLDKKQKK